MVAGGLQNLPRPLNRTSVIASGDQVRVRSHDHIILPPLEDQYGFSLGDEARADFFQVWSDGHHSRWIAFAAINIIESEAPTRK